MERKSSQASDSSDKSSPPLLRPSFRDTKKHFANQDTSKSPPPSRASVPGAVAQPGISSTGDAAPAQDAKHLADRGTSKAPPAVRASVPGAVAQSISSSVGDGSGGHAAAGAQHGISHKDPRVSAYTGRTQSQARLAEGRRRGRKLKHIKTTGTDSDMVSVGDGSSASYSLSTSSGGGSRELPRMNEEGEMFNAADKKIKQSAIHGGGGGGTADAALNMYNDPAMFMGGNDAMIKQRSPQAERMGLANELIKQVDKKHSPIPGQYAVPRPALGDPAAAALGFSELGIPTDEPGLAVAVAVSEEEHRRSMDGVYNMPVGVEFDPDAKPPIHRNRRCQFYGVVISFVLCVFLISAGVILLKVEGKDGGAVDMESLSPTASPTTDEEGAFKEQLARGVTYRVYLEGTPQWRAAEWIIHHDPLKLDPSAPNLLQRYILVLFYMKTSDEGPWRTCNPNNSTGDSDCIFDKLFRNEDDEIDYKQEAATAWLSYEHECNWVGVLCDDFDEVRTITLWGNNLTGTLPTELSALPYLTSISLPYNRFKGRLPIDYATMKHISNIEVHGNSLTGDIPETYYDSIGLKRLSVGQNRLTGTISTRIGEMTNLKGFHIEKNLFRGSIPTEIGMLSELAFTRWNKNRFSGSIPSEFGMLRKLKELWMHANQFTGTLPTELGLLGDMNDLRIFANSITGTIPESIFDLVGVWRLDLMDMQLSGTLSTRLGKLVNLMEFRVRRNQLDGTVPTEIGHLKKLKLLWLHLNLFEGDIPNEICENVEPGELQYFNADCGPMENPAQSCSCCHGCCDRSNELCLLQGDNVGASRSSNGENGKRYFL
mmetsp:Transcript_34541/g.51265  ORF Transcript_34541/g.51265 Transcript_34541/m.51265 type:complete len:825 (-) Transcript_34541:59-2533(-)|eukprot:CAMPEP_0194047050 /NCGR_PEP_ID=MMETSP0009_2-20130614/23529_1 /TAXON_ID=210454 /ORGANISM="Grammatophora oceanica, Strain CCMP 410" /LENGTH=824 /DNA_ID=CAMNT_0038692563 /DNA_START=104 /DNA_END=2578 /DNA_ORIENTATION=-